METTEPTLEALVEAAKAGEKAALEDVVRRIQDDIYRLAIKMLWHPEDAEDATQEILIRIVTRLGSFRSESAFTTWAYRVAANYLLTTRKRRAERTDATFEAFGQDLDEGLSDMPVPGASEAEQRLLVEEVKIGCSQGMLLCLDRDHRMVYVLGEVFEVTGPQGAALLGITPAAFRKRLSRARTRIRRFMQQKCGIVNPDNACRCRRRVHRAIELGRVDPNRLLYATHPTRPRRAGSVRRNIEEMEALHEAAAVFQSHPDFAAPASLLEGIKGLVQSGNYQLLA